MEDIHRKIHRDISGLFAHHSYRLPVVEAHIHPMVRNDLYNSLERLQAHDHHDTRAEQRDMQGGTHLDYRVDLESRRFHLDLDLDPDLRISLHSLRFAKCILPLNFFHSVGLDLNHRDTHQPREHLHTHRVYIHQFHMDLSVQLIHHDSLLRIGWYRCYHHNHIQGRLLLYKLDRHFVAHICLVDQYVHIRPREDRDKTDHLGTHQDLYYHIAALILADD